MKDCCSPRRMQERSLVWRMRPAGEELVVHPYRGTYGETWREAVAQADLPRPQQGIASAPTRVPRHSSRRSRLGDEASIGLSSLAWYVPVMSIRIE